MYMYIRYGRRVGRFRYHLLGRYGKTFLVINGSTDLWNTMKCLIESRQVSERDN